MSHQDMPTQEKVNSQSIAAVAEVRSIFDGFCSDAHRLMQLSLCDKRPTMQLLTWTIEQITKLAKEMQQMRKTGIALGIAAAANIWTENDDKIVAALQKEIRAWDTKKIRTDTFS
jgi:hypothetical protein